MTKKYDFFPRSNLCACVLFSFWPPGSLPEPGTQGHVMSIRPLIGRNGSREQIEDVSHANEARDPLKQYPYCLSRALIG